DAVLPPASCYPRNLPSLRDFMKIKSSTLTLALLFVISAAAQTTPHFDGQTWWNHIKFLADDKLEGRDTGSRGEREALSLGEDAIIITRVMPAPEVEAPLVFVGYGLKVPEKNYDDFASVDLRGKIIVILAGSPSEIPGALASHYQTAAERWKVLRAAGAVGIVSLP